MILSFTRSRGEQLEVDDDGAFRMRRVNGASSAGWFAGHLDAGLPDQLRGAVAAVEAVGRPERDQPWTPGGTTETLFGSEGDVLLELDAHEEPHSPWAEAVSLARHLLDELISQPVAAIHLEITASPLAAHLRHIGHDAVAADLADAAVEAYLSGPDGATLSSWASKMAPGAAPGGSVEPGWAWDLGLTEAGFALQPGQSCQVAVTFALRDRRPLPASVTASVP
jgi:hypothetical protein